MLDNLDIVKTKVYIFIVTKLSTSHIGIIILVEDP